MSLPKQVQRQAEEVQRIDDELAAANAPAPEPVEEPDPPPEEPTGQSLEVQPVTTTPAPAPIGDDEDTWRQRYQTLQGMFNAEIPRLNEQIRNMQAQLNARPVAPPPAPVPEKVERLVTEKDIEAFGGDLVDLAKRVAREIVAEQRGDLTKDILPLKAEVENLRKHIGTVEQTQGNASRQQYFDALSRQVPDYEAINADARWLSWLSEVDRLSGLKRQAFLDNAFEQFDVNRTAALFEAFKATIAPPPALQEAPRPAALERQITPSTTKASAAAPLPGQPGTRTFSMREIEGFYRDVSQGKYVGKDDERARLETEIDSAVAEGRLTP
jgi:hypothetical protein